MLSCQSCSAVDAFQVWNFAKCSWLDEMAEPMHFKTTRKALVLFISSFATSIRIDKMPNKRYVMLYLNLNKGWVLTICIADIVLNYSLVTTGMAKAIRILLQTVTRGGTSYMAFIGPVFYNTIKTRWLWMSGKRSVPDFGGHKLANTQYIGLGSA